MKLFLFIRKLKSKLKICFLFFINAKKKIKKLINKLKKQFFFNFLSK